MLSRLLTKREQIVLSAVALSIAGGSVVLYAGRTGMNAPVRAATSAPTQAPTADPINPQQNANPPRPSQVASVTAPEVSKPSTVPAETFASLPATVTVAVAGAVARPGTYTLEAGARVSDILREAGGAAEEADLADINAAAELIDGSTLTVPRAAQMGMQDGRLVLRPGTGDAAINPAEYTVSGWQGTSRSTDSQPSATAATNPAGPAANPALINLNTATAEQLQDLPGIGPKLAGEIVNYRTRNRFGCAEDLLNIKGIGPKRLEAIKPLVTVQ